MSELKTFHKVICEASGYSHDEVDWRRDQLSLAEHIRWKIQRLESQLEVAKETIKANIRYAGNGCDDYLGNKNIEALKKIEKLEGETKPEYIVGGDGMYINEGKK